ncbi:MAG TPA: 3-dehydroquinate synthase [Anaerolineae bacterium]|nr:3-dehydroquinate synthase [Anaerolineae bacterium]
MIRHIVEVELGDRSYPIYIGDHILHGFAEKFREKFERAKAAIITNPTVWELYGDQVTESLSTAGVGYDLITVPDGEHAKSLSVAERIYGELIQKGFERKDAVIALGGGVVGDLAGFVASTYERGIAYIQVPTTLLAQVDSSVGGKVAVNHELGKNMIGTFYQPSFVYIDVTTLKTLPDRDFAGGMAEVIKYGFIKGGPLLDVLGKRRDDILAREMDVLAEIATSCCSIKSSIVEEDERDTGIRAVLNYGHTLGHAIESVSGYKYTHGEAIAVGMVFAAKLGERLGMLSADIVELHKQTIGAYGLPTTVSANADKLIQVMERDKKRATGGHVFVVLDGIGNPVIRNIGDEVLVSCLDEFLKEG